MFLVLWGAVGLVLLLVYTNVAGLLLVRLASRGGEYSIKLALGAGRLRLVRQMLTEVGLLTILGAGLGWILARGGVRLLLNLKSLDVPRIENVTFDSATLVFFTVTFVATVSLVAIARWCHLQAID